MLPPTSIVVTSYNRAEKLKNLIDSLLRLDYPKYEIIVVDDGSTDDTSDLLKSYGKKIKIITHKKNKGTSAGKNSGILASKHKIVTLIDDDCIVAKDWLKNLISVLMKNIKRNVAAVTSVSIYSGHSICYVKDIVVKAGLFDENFSIPFREDTDLAFRIFDLGYKIIYTPKAKFIHDPPLPRTFWQKLTYFKRRLFVHQMDVLLFKKHPKRTKEFLNVKFRVSSPIDDFKRATGLWKKKGKFELSSPQGITILPGNIFTFPLIFLGGIIYAILIRFIHLHGSIRFRKLLL